MSEVRHPVSVEYRKMGPPVYRDAAGRILDDAEVAALAAAERKAHMSESREILENYLRRIGLSRPADAAQQVQITLLRQWTEHLDQVLADERLPGDQRARIVRAVIYGGVPTLAEAEIRQEMTREMIQMAERGTPRLDPQTEYLRTAGKYPR